EGAEDQLLVGLGSEVPPLPEEVLYDDRHSAEAAAKDQRIGELERQIADLRAIIEEVANEKRVAEARANELQARISSLEAERQTLRKEMDEQRESMTYAANQ